MDATGSNEAVLGKASGASHNSIGNATLQRLLAAKRQPTKAQGQFRVAERRPGYAFPHAIDSPARGGTIRHAPAGQTVEATVPPAAERQLLVATS